MSKQLVTVQLSPQDANLQAVSRKYGVRPSDLDEVFGVVDLGQGDGQYAVLAEDAAVAKIAGSESGRGPFSNPRIESFGL